MWRKILKVRQLAITLHRIKVHNGKSASFWYDNWATGERRIDLTGIRGAIDLGIPLDSSVLKATQLVRQRNYRSDILKTIVEDLNATARHLIASREDEHQWKVSATKYKNSFISKHTRELVRNRSPRFIWAHGIWYPNSTPKQSFITWLASRNRLSTGEIMEKWGNSQQLGCSFCNNNLETQQHIFFSCSFSNEIWFEISSGLLLGDFTSDWNRLLHAVTKGLDTRIKTFLLRYAFQTSIYFIWRERNTRRKAQTSSTPSSIAKAIDKNIRNRLSSLMVQDLPLYKDGLKEWFQTRFSTVSNDESL